MATTKKKERALYREWLGGSNKRPAIVRVEALGGAGFRWFESCPGHGGLPYASWPEAQAGMEAHLSGFMHRPAVTR